ncbi:MAG: F0F1 ATP synthase subunit epsilon [Actinomycetota bacterium]|nr:F0F1 ATP synthase subunit epsilon [Actinomycetota bacterium]
MRLRVFSPIHEEVDEQVVQVAVQAVGGSFTMLERHVDTVAELEAGLLSYIDPGGAERIVAVDGGTVVKVGDDVLVSTPEAIAGGELETLRAVVDERFLARAEREEAARLALAHLEVDVIERMVELEEPR